MAEIQGLLLSYTVAFIRSQLSAKTWAALRRSRLSRHWNDNSAPRASEQLERKFGVFLFFFFFFFSSVVSCHCWVTFQNADHTFVLQASSLMGSRPIQQDKLTIRIAAADLLRRAPFRGCHSQTFPSAQSSGTLVVVTPSCTKLNLLMRIQKLTAKNAFATPHCCPIDVFDGLTDLTFSACDPLRAFGLILGQAK